MSTWHVAIDENRIVLSVHPEAELSAAQESARSHSSRTGTPTRVEQVTGRSKPAVGLPMPRPKPPKGWNETSAEYVTKISKHGVLYMCRHCRRKPITAGLDTSNHKLDCHLRVKA